MTTVYIWITIACVLFAAEIMTLGFALLGFAQQDKQQQQPQQDQNKMSKENAEQLLNAAMQEERNTKEKMEKMLQQPRSKQLEKNW